MCQKRNLTNLLKNFIVINLIKNFHPLHCINYKIPVPAHLKQFLPFLLLFLIHTGNDLDSIRALFSEKEKELSLAVAKVEALTRQLEELRRDRRGLNLITNNGNNQQAGSPAARELEKLRRELMVN